MTEETKWKNPLPNCTWSLPCGKYHPAGFGARRTYNLHTGIDLFCEHMQPLAAVEAGKIINITDFSKNKKPWLNRTRVILIEGQAGVVSYCSVLERNGLKIGQTVMAGEIIGNVIRINKKKRKNDICMLHIELYAHGVKNRKTWSYFFPKPLQLLDPSKYLLSIITDNKVVYRKYCKPHPSLSVDG